MTWLKIWWPVMVAVTIIALESTAYFSSEQTGHWLASLLDSLFGPEVVLPWEKINAFLRKVGHFTGYGLASLAFFRAWRLTQNKVTVEVWREMDRYSLARTLLCIFVLASADEFHQSFLPSRTGAVADVMLDVLGAMVAQACLYVGMAYWQKQAKIH